MSDWQFGDPSGAGDQWKAADHVGRLVAFVEPERKEVDTKFGASEATQCRYIVVLDGDEPGTVFDNPLVFGNISRDAYGMGEQKIVLGRVTVGTPKPGQSAPYILDPASDEDKALAGQWFQANAEVNPLGRVVIRSAA